MASFHMTTEGLIITRQVEGRDQMSGYPYTSEEKILVALPDCSGLLHELKTNLPDCIAKAVKLKTAERDKRIAQLEAELRALKEAK